MGGEASGKRDAYANDSTFTAAAASTHFASRQASEDFGMEWLRDMDRGGLWGGFPCFLGFFLVHCFKQGREVR